MRLEQETEFLLFYVFESKGKKMSAVIHPDRYV